MNISLLSRVESGLDPILAILEKHVNVYWPANSKEVHEWYLFIQVRSEGSKKVKDLASSGNIVAVLKQISFVI